MPRVTLLEKVYGLFSPDAFEPVFSSLCKRLKVEVRVIGKSNRGWIQVEISGEDEIAALHFIDQEIGLAPVSLGKMKKFSVVRGRIVFSAENKSGLYVDMGVFCPEDCDAIIPLQRLQAQIADGKKLPITRLIELFCLYDNLPLEIKILSNVNVRSREVEAQLSEAQLSQITRWISVYLDRLVVLGVPRFNIEHALRASKHFRDVLTIESLGLLEHVIMCKLGTDALGLIPELGHFIPNAFLAPFCPRKIQSFVDRSFL